jgi:ATP-binding cassette, subfamily B, bacterial
MTERPTRTRALVAHYLRPHRRTVVALVVGLIAATALPLAGPQLLRRFIDQAVAGGPTGVLTGTAVLYLGVTLAAQIVTVVATYAASKLTWTATNRLREDLVEHILGLDLAFHGQHTPGELIERVDGDVTSLADFLARFLFQVVGSALLLVGAVVLVFVEDLRVGAALVAFLAVAAVIVTRMQRAAVPRAEAEREATAQFTGLLEERLGGAEELRALGASDHTMYRFHQANVRAYQADYGWQRFSGRLLAATNLLFALGTALMLTAGILLLRRGSMTVGTVVLLFQYTTMVRNPLQRIIDQFKEMQKAAAGASRVLQLLRERRSILERPGAASLPAAGPLAVRFDRVTFAYPSDPDDHVLHDVSFELAPGRSLGLVGRTGSGKSTIARLLLRLYESGDGVVAIGGHDVRDVALASLRDRVRLVTQDVQLFGADVRDNLTVFARDVDDDHMREVLDELGLGAWLRALPDGLDTVLGAGGTGVSAGEAQLLAFARVFLADPGLVILDEASSRLDPATELLIDRAMTKLMRDRTAVVIAHRLSSLERVDEIAVLDHGRMIEHGPREELAEDPASRYGELLRIARLGTAS